VKLNVRLECVSAGCLDRVPVALDSLDRLGLAGIEFAVVAGVTEGQNSDQDDGEELSTDGGPQTGTGQEARTGRSARCSCGEARRRAAIELTCIEGNRLVGRRSRQ